MHMLTRKDQWVTVYIVDKTKKTKIPESAKTIEKTRTIRQTKISEPIGSQSHRTNKQNTKNTKMSEPMGSQNHKDNKTKQNK